MSRDWIVDIEKMHHKFGVHEWTKKMVEENNWHNLKEFVRFRLDFLQEEVDETRQAFEEGDAEGIIDGLIDLIFVAMTTLDAYDISLETAWNEVYKANMRKEPGVKPSRPNPLGLPDMVKDSEWEPPSHKNNTAILGLALEMKDDEELEWKEYHAL